MNGNAHNRKKRGSSQVLVRVPSDAEQVLLLAVAASRRVATTVPGRSKRRVLLNGDEREVADAVRVAARLAVEFEAQRLGLLVELLEANGIPVPLKLATAQMLAEAKLSLAEFPDNNGGAALSLRMVKVSERSAKNGERNETRCSGSGMARAACSGLRDDRLP